MSVSVVDAYSMAQRRTVWLDWCALVKVALNRQTDALRY